MNSKAMRRNLFVLILHIAFLYSTTIGPLFAEERAEFPLMQVGDKYTATDKYRTWTWEVKQVKDDKSFVLDEYQEDSSNAEKVNVDKNYFIDSSGSLRNVKLDFPLFVGKKWKDSFIDQSPKYTNQSFRYDASYEVTEFRVLRTPAGEYKAYKISATITNKDSFRSVHNYETYNGDFWYSPEMKMIIKANLPPYASYAITAYSSLNVATVAITKPEPIKQQGEKEQKKIVITKQEDSTHLFDKERAEFPLMQVGDKYTAT
ncbi:MAG: hypothetical protein HQL10_02660, partial [Nitrospirae bacterium]|nr:hypothetical protein [Nitrospirota bacterium]